MSGSLKRSFSPGDEILSGRNKASPEAYSSDTANGYVSENDAFFFCPVSQRSRKLFTTAWKSYESGPFHCYVALAPPLAPLKPVSEKFIRHESEVIFDRQQLCNACQAS